MAPAVRYAKNVGFALVPIIGVLAILAVPQRLGLSLVTEEIVLTMLGFGVFSAFLHYPYRKEAGLLEVILAVAGFAAWFWAAFNFEPWLVELADRTPEKWVPGAIAIILLLEALRKAGGLPITLLVIAGLVYAFFGHLIPDATLQATYNPPTKIIIEIYAQTGVPGLVLKIVGSLVLAFIIFGRLMEVSGATNFFTDLAMGGMGHRRGGPAKVAVVASSAFGMVSSSIVGNIMSTGIVTIPLMKRSGFKARYAAAIEAVSSNGGQIAPPIMGATAFLIAEFLEISYTDVVIAAAIPALLYYVVIFLQVDAMARRENLEGLPKSELPRVLTTLLHGWHFLIPIAVLLYFLFGLGYTASLSALYATGTLFALMIVRRRGFPPIKEISDFVIGSGENLLTILLIGGAAGIIIAVMDQTGLGFQLSIILGEIGKTYGLLAMLLMTALVAIVLGMGMPTAAVYIVLATVLASAMIQLGVEPMAAHLFLFYFGLLSMLTPPVAVASYVAAGLAGSNMWATGMVGMRLALAAYLLPFLWVYNPSLLLIGSPLSIGIVVFTAIVASYVLAIAAENIGRPSTLETVLGLVYLAAAIFIGGSTVWFGHESMLAVASGAIGVVGVLLIRVADRRQQRSQQKSLSLP